ncbi:MAG: hypothetical protein KatS3mg108_0667 [Isosphaeraceae bacterium]|nr:MAG: hypothetical protein KatS3mg108_0667 [Isosphaeraceae bacterium]
MTSPPAMVPRARHVIPLMESLTNFTLAVAQEDVHPLGVVAPGGDGGVGRAPVHLADAGEVRIDPVRPAESLLVRGPGGGEPGLMDVAVDPFGVAARRERAGAAPILRGDRVGIGIRAGDAVRAVDLGEAAAIAEIRLVGLRLRGEHGVRLAVPELGPPPAHVRGEGTTVGLAPEAAPGRTSRPCRSRSSTRPPGRSRALRPADSARWDRAGRSPSARRRWCSRGSCRGA